MQEVFCFWEFSCTGLSFLLSSFPAPPCIPLWSLETALLRQGFGGKPPYVGERFWYFTPKSMGSLWSSGWWDFPATMWKLKRRVKYVWTGENSMSPTWSIRMPKGETSQCLPGPIFSWGITGFTRQTVGSGSIPLSRENRFREKPG